MTLTRKPRVGDRIGFGEFVGPGCGLVAAVKEADKPRFTVTRVGQAGDSDENLCWIREDGKPAEPKFSLPFIWKFSEGLNRLAKIFEKEK